MAEPQSLPGRPDAQVDDHAYALDAFVEYTEAVGAITDVRELARQAIAVLDARFPGSSTLYSEPEGERWKARAWSPNLSPELLQLVTQGVPATPLVNELLRVREVVVREAPGPDGHLDHTEQYGTVVGFPVQLNGEVRGVLALAVPERGWTGRARALVEAVGRSLNLALGRAEVARERDEERNALSTFAAFTEAVSAATDLPTLVQLAFSILPTRFPHAVVGYYEPRGDVWTLQAYTGTVNPELIGNATTGQIPSHPAAQHAIRSGEVVFVDHWDQNSGTLLGNATFGKVAFYPLTVHGEVQAGLVFGVQTLRVWGERDKALVRAIGRSFSLAFERTATATTLQRQKAELEARTRAMNAFVDLTRDLTLQTDRIPLVRRAQEVVMSLLPDGYAVYYEPENNFWQARSQHGAINNPALQALVNRGIPVEDTRELVQPWTTRQPVYQGAFERGGEALDEAQREAIGSTATVPVLVHDAPVGLFVVVLFERRPWTSVDKATLETVVQSLGLALERAHSVAQLAEERRKLQAANEELEAFAYSLSHDLRAPVRHVLAFNRLLGQALGDDLAPQPARYLQVVREAALRMDTLIDAMLDLARTASLPLRLGPVDLGALLDEVRSALEAEALDRPVRWVIRPLPVVMADRDTLRQVLTNLLSNALKYSRTREETQVTVWAEDQPDAWSVSVQDNGVGFDPRYQDRLFGVFQRLHSAEDFEGTGVGLANVRRIVARHGGQVFARSTPGEGAVFGFTLPRRP
ncbi:ATP-binding protein [Deinococcus sonorensis]|uniref:histidine kinase n=2 Tax=Deinococcus sonorensis TaxID=309891 RepID=A0AAU7UEG3_9DEIO